MCTFRTSKFTRNAWKSAVYLRESKNQRNSSLDVGYRREKTGKTWKKTKKWNFTDTRNSRARPKNPQTGQFTHNLNHWYPASVWKEAGRGISRASVRLYSDIIASTRRSDVLASLPPPFPLSYIHISFLSYISLPPIIIAYSFVILIRSNPNLNPREIDNTTSRHTDQERTDRVYVI